MFACVHVRCFAVAGPANGTSSSPRSAAQASNVQASLVLSANAAFSTMGRR